MSYKVMTVEYFEKRLKKLSKKYKRIVEDYKSLIDKLENNPEGDAVPGFSTYTFAEIR